MTKYVVARSYRDYLQWCFEHDLNPLDSRQARYISRLEDTCGVRPSTSEQIVDRGGDYELVLRLRAHLRSL